MEVQIELDGEYIDTDVDPGIDDASAVCQHARSVCMPDCVSSNSIIESDGSNSEDKKCDASQDGFNSGEHSQTDLSYVPYNSPQDDITGVLVENGVEGHDVLEEVSRTLASLFRDENYNVRQRSQSEVQCDCPDVVLPYSNDKSPDSSVCLDDIKNLECIGPTENVKHTTWTENVEDFHGCMLVEDTVNDLKCVHPSVHINTVEKTETKCTNSICCAVKRNSQDLNNNTSKDCTQNKELLCHQIEFACKLQLMPSCSRNNSQPIENNQISVSNGSQTLYEDDDHNLNLMDKGKEICNSHCNSGNEMLSVQSEKEKSISNDECMEVCEKNQIISRDDELAEHSESFSAQIPSDAEISSHVEEPTYPLVDTSPLNNETELRHANETSTEVTLTMDRLVVKKYTEEFVGGNGHAHIICNQYAGKQGDSVGNRLKMGRESKDGGLSPYPGSPPVSQCLGACSGQDDPSTINETNTGDLEKIVGPCSNCWGPIAVHCDNRQQEIGTSQENVSAPSLESHQMQKSSQEKCMLILPQTVESLQGLTQVCSEFSQSQQIYRSNEATEKLSLLLVNTHPRVVATENRELDSDKLSNREKHSDKSRYDNVDICCNEDMCDELISVNRNMLNSDLSSRNEDEINGEKHVIDDSIHSGNRTLVSSTDDNKVLFHYTGANDDVDITVEGIDFKGQPRSQSGNNPLELTENSSKCESDWFSGDICTVHYVKMYLDGAISEPDTQILNDKDENDIMNNVGDDECVLQSVPLYSEAGNLSEEHMKTPYSFVHGDTNTIGPLPETLISCAGSTISCVESTMSCEGQSNIVQVATRDVMQCEQIMQSHIPEKEFLNSNESAASSLALGSVTTESSVQQSSTESCPDATVPSIVHQIADNGWGDRAPCRQITNYYVADEDFQFLSTQPFTASVSDVSIADYLQESGTDPGLDRNQGLDGDQHPMNQASLTGLEPMDHAVPCDRPDEDDDDVTMYDDSGQCHVKDKLSLKSHKGFQQTPSFKWKYAPSLDLESTAQSPADTSHDADSMLTALPLKACTRPIRIGLSRRYRAKPLHGRNNKF